MFARKIATQTSRKATNSSTPSDTRSAAIVRACPLDKASKVARQTSVSRQHNSYTKYVPLQPATGQVHLHSVHACKTKENPWHPPCGRWSQHVKYESTQQLTFFSVEHLETSSKSFAVSLPRYNEAVAAVASVGGHFTCATQLRSQKRSSDCAVVIQAWECLLP